MESGYHTPSSASTSSDSTACSTPGRIVADNPPEAMKKISVMEGELLALRQQIAVLVLAQEQTARQMGEGSLYLIEIQKYLKFKN